METKSAVKNCIGQVAKTKTLENIPKNTSHQLLSDGGAPMGYIFLIIMMMMMMIIITVSKYPA